MTTSIAASVADQTQVSRVGMRIPAMIRDEPDLWFAQLESQFLLCGITLDNTKYVCSMSQLEARYTLKVKDLIKNPPAENNALLYSHPTYIRETPKYTTGENLREALTVALKRLLIQRLTISQEQKIRQLLEHEELGDRKPTQFLRHLKALAGASVPEELLRTLWLSRLLSQLQVVLASRHKDPLDEVAEQADKIVEISGNTLTVAATSQQVPSNGNEIERQIVILTKQVAALTTQFGRRPSVKRSSIRNRSRTPVRERRNNFICYYHKKFKNEAQKCEYGCQWQKRRGNESGSH
ncbi:uncharacterized protein [Cardiocondyla obscurior]|uniref:uncharacterized protein n=1 Tax=Cardiocondyla obscurior TaxID=286306 RepID=UPI0039657802